MGIVYASEQMEPIRRLVALKLIKSGMDTREIVRRFEGERQALAMMDHPGIARVLDAGETEAGRPFFVMEQVEGEMLTRFCDNRRLGTRERLEIFLQVCSAVQHAHQKGIIHRDLKPGNILVRDDDTGAFEAKVIDFGIAKSMVEERSGATLMTAEGRVLGTPQYMSPEQAGAGPVDTRTDIYALGVILYELLTGGPPLQRETLKGAGIDEVLRRIREEEADRPSLRFGGLDEPTATDLAERRSEGVERWRRSLRGDLDWIALKSLEKEAARRYGSAGEFAEDVQRFLSDEPVEARPPSRSYQVRKFVRRHRGLVASVGVMFVVLFVAAGVSLRWALEAQEARRLAEDRLAQADAVPEFLIDAFRSVDPSEGRSELLAVDVLDQAVEQAIEEFSTQPVMRARILGALATTYQGLGYYDKAEATLQRAAELTGDLADLPPDLRSQLLVVRSETYRLERRTQEALEVSRRNVDLVTEAHGSESLPALTARREHLLNLINVGDLDRAEALMGELQVVAEGLGTQAVQDNEALLALLRAAQGRFDEAIPLLERRLRDHGGSLVEGD